MPVFNLAEILSFIGNLAREAFKMIILKAILISLAIFILPWALRKAWFLISNTIWSIVKTIISGFNIPLSPVVSVEGIAGYLFDCFRVPEIMSMLFSAFMAAFLIRRIKP